MNSRKRKIHQTSIPPIQARQALKQVKTNTGPNLLVKRIPNLVPTNVKRVNTIPPKKPPIDPKIMKGPLFKGYNSLKTPPVDLTKVNKIQLQKDIKKILNEYGSKANLSEEESKSLQVWLQDKSEELLNLEVDTVLLTKQIEDVNLEVEICDQEGKEEEMEYDADNQQAENWQVEIDTYSDEISLLEDQINQVQLELECLNFDSTGIQTQLMEEQQEELRYYEEKIMRRELINHSVKRGPYLVGIIRDESKVVGGQEKKHNYVTMVDKEQKKTTWQMNKIVRGDQLDFKSDPDEMLFDYILPKYQQAVPNLPHFQHMSIFCFGSSLYLKLLSHFGLDPTPNTDISFTIQSVKLADRKFTICNFDIDKQFDLSMKYLNKLKQLSFKLQKIDHKQYLVDKLCKELSKDCKSTLDLFKLYTQSHSQIMFLLDLDYVSTLPPDFHLLVMTMKKFKFQLM